MAEPLSPALQAVSDAVLAVAAQLSVEPVLQRLVDTARELAQARFAALGIPDGEGGFRRFLVSGMEEKLIAAMGPLPRTHGLLGAMLEASDSFRTPDIHADPRFRGWWPQEHPDMRSFLGVPIVSAGGVIGAFYLTDKRSGDGFSLRINRSSSCWRPTPRSPSRTRGSTSAAASSRFSPSATGSRSSSTTPSARSSSA